MCPQHTRFSYSRQWEARLDYRQCTQLPVGTQLPGLTTLGTQPTGSCVRAVRGAQRPCLENEQRVGDAVEAVRNRLRRVIAGAG